MFLRASVLSQASTILLLFSRPYAAREVVGAHYDSSQGKYNKMRGIYTSQPQEYISRMLSIYRTVTGIAEGGWIDAALSGAEFP